MIDSIYAYIPYPHITCPLQALLKYQHEMKSTLRSIRGEDDPLRDLLRTLGGTGGPPIGKPWLVEPPDSNKFSEQLPALPASGGQGSSAGGAVDAPSGGQGASSAAVTAPAEGQGASGGSGESPDASSKRPRKAQHCLECGLGSLEGSASVPGMQNTREGARRDQTSVEHTKDVRGMCWEFKSVCECLFFGRCVLDIHLLGVF